jgi:hypothetical protein
MNGANKNTERKSQNFWVLVVISLLALFGVIKELNQLREAAAEAGKVLASWTDVLVPTANAGNPVAAKSCSFKRTVAWTPSADGFKWNGVVNQGQSIEIKGINGDVQAEPSNGNEVEVVATKKARRSDVNSVELKVVQHAGGVTICALYPSDGYEPNTCEPGENKGRNSARNNDVRVDFVVRVPYRVGFAGRTINGEISATSLSGNVISRTINGSIKISTTGYADASTINGEIQARVGDASWPKDLSFSTINGGITLDLPSNASAEVDAKTMNGSITSDFPLETSNFNRKHIKGKIGVGGRSLTLKTLNGSINLRVAS